MEKGTQMAVLMLFSPSTILGREDADDGEEDAVDADGFSEGVAAGEELGFGIAADDADVGALLLFLPVEESAFVGVEGEDVQAFGAHAVDGPGVGVEVVLDGGVLEHDGGDGADAGDGVPDAIDVVHSEADADAGLVAAGLLGGAAGIDLRYG